MATSDEVVMTLKRLEEGIQRLEAGQQRLEIYTKGIMYRLLSPEEVAQVEREANQMEQPSQPLTAGR